MSQSFPARTPTPAFNDEWAYQLFGHNIPIRVEGIDTPEIRGKCQKEKDLASVAYIQGGNLWVKKLPEGEAKQPITSGKITNPRWSPSGQWLAYLKGGQLGVLQCPGDLAKS